MCVSFPIFSRSLQMCAFLIERRPDLLRRHNRWRCSPLCYATVVDLVDVALKRQLPRPLMGVLELPPFGVSLIFKWNFTKPSACNLIWVLNPPFVAVFLEDSHVVYAACLQGHNAVACKLVEAGLSATKGSSVSGVSSRDVCFTGWTSMQIHPRLHSIYPKPEYCPLGGDCKFFQRPALLQFF